MRTDQDGVPRSGGDESFRGQKWAHSGPCPKRADAKPTCLAGPAPVWDGLLTVEQRDVAGEEARMMGQL
jgi:hypothetical protein